MVPLSVLKGLLNLNHDLGMLLWS